MRELHDRAGTIVLVSHGLATVRELATQVCLLHEGRVRALGDPGEIVDAYAGFARA